MTIAESLREVMECSVLPRQALPVFAREKFVISMTNREALHAFGVPVCHDAKFRGMSPVKTGMLSASRQGWEKRKKMSLYRNKQGRMGRAGRWAKGTPVSGGHAGLNHGTMAPSLFHASTPSGGSASGGHGGLRKFSAALDVRCRLFHV